ncbi:uncharacterized protein LOC111640896 isoform X1 [Centruroides sculpturatus]|uniref:uncharacterized protein LOC111640896 isoform X1 n=1 Tax=Centruroides sculpturatus TaxID=218467 RepID=UPI000C6EDC6D|nr:uncharacterized protein LOC111640896 isoform X1 [Centruroides sculpturatus]
MKLVIILFTWMMFYKFVSSRHINQQVNHADDVRKETTLELQLNQLLRQFPRANIDQSYLPKTDDVSSEEYEEEMVKKDSLIRSQRDSISDEDTSPEVVYGKLVFYPSSMPVDPTHRSSTEVESAFLTQFLPSIAKDWKETTTPPSRSDLSNKKGRKNRKTDTNKSSKEEKLLETVIQLAEKYGADAKLGDMLKKLCENSTVTCKGVENPKEEDNKKYRRKQNSRQQINGKNERRKKPKSKVHKNQIIQSSNPEDSEPKWNKSIQTKVKNNARKNTKSNDVILVREKGKIGTYSRSPRRLMPSGIDKPTSKSWRRPSKNNVASTMAPSEDLEKELIDLEDITEKANRRLRDHWAIKNKSRERLQKHIEQQIELHRRIRRQLSN